MGITFLSAHPEIRGGKGRVWGCLGQVQDG